MGRQFEDVSSARGAPMGRSSYGAIMECEQKISLFKVVLHQGYDDGGAYWGCGDALFCARTVPGHDAEYRDFTRAKNREDARVKLGIPQGLMAKPTVKVARKPMGELVRRLTLRPYGNKTRPFFTLCVYSVGKLLSDRRIGYILKQGPRTLFSNDQYYRPSAAAEDSFEVLSRILTLVCAEEGRFAESFFDEYTREQFEFRDKHAGNLYAHFMDKYYGVSVQKTAALGV